MPSVIIDNRSGGHLIISGNFWSGVIRPQGGIQFKADPQNSGNVYVALSGNVTVRSGSFPLSGGIYSGGLDGMLMGPGDAYWVAALGFANRGGPTSGIPNIYAATDAACSGQARLFFEVY